MPHLSIEHRNEPFSHFWPKHFTFCFTFCLFNFFYFNGMGWNFFQGFGTCYVNTHTHKFYGHYSKRLNGPEKKWVTLSHTPCDHIGHERGTNLYSWNVSEKSHSHSLHRYHSHQPPLTPDPNHLCSDHLQIPNQATFKSTLHPVYHRSTVHYPEQYLTPLCY